MAGAVNLEPGQKVDAAVVKITADWVFLDIGQKAEGVLDRKELLDDEGNLTVEEGQTLSAYFLSRSGGELRFTTRIGSGKAGKAQMEEAWRSGIPVEGFVEKEIKGGYEVRLAGSLRAFCPYSQMALRGGAPEQFLEKNLPFRVAQFSEGGRNIVLSHRALLEEERRKQREELQKSLREGMTVRGTITSLRDFGAFVDIGGVEGLLPISEVAWGRVEDIAEVLSVGQELEVVVKQVDWESNRFGFSLREAQADPWQRVPDRYPEGSRHAGKVARLTTFGAFVTLEPGVDGLVHISKLGGGKRISHPREVLSEGQSLEVRVESVDTEQRRLSLAPAGEEAGREAAELPASLQEAPSLGTFGDLLKAKFGGKGARKK